MAFQKTKEVNDSNTMSRVSLLIATNNNEESLTVAPTIRVRESKVSFEGIVHVNSKIICLYI